MCSGIIVTIRLYAYRLKACSHYISKPTCIGLERWTFGFSVQTATKAEKSFKDGLQIIKEKIIIPKHNKYTDLVTGVHVDALSSIYYEIASVLKY